MKKIKKDKEEDYMIQRIWEEAEKSSPLKEEEVKKAYFNLMIRIKKQAKPIERNKKTV